MVLINSNYMLFLDKKYLILELGIIEEALIQEPFALIL
jgi:hypothetical protein